MLYIVYELGKYIIVQYIKGELYDISKPILKKYVRKLIFQPLRILI